MTEDNIFCYAETYNGEDSFQQKRYRIFNKVVGKDRYEEIKELIDNDIFKDFKLDLKDNSWKEAWGKLGKDKIKRLQEIPEFNADIFTAITEIDLDEKQETIEIEGKKYTVTEIKEALKK